MPSCPFYFILKAFRTAQNLQKAVEETEGLLDIGLSFQIVPWFYLCMVGICGPKKWCGFFFFARCLVWLVGIHQVRMFATGPQAGLPGGKPPKNCD